MIVSGAVLFLRQLKLRPNDRCVHKHVGPEDDAEIRSDVTPVGQRPSSCRPESPGGIL